MQQCGPILQLADSMRPYIVTTNVSDFAMGAMLSRLWDDGGILWPTKQENERYRAELPNA